jgi:hypothetical protein
LNTLNPSFASDELLSRLDGLLADLRALRAEVHGLSADATVDAAHADDGGTTKKKPKKHKKAKGKKKAKARNG